MRALAVARQGYHKVAAGIQLAFGPNGPTLGFDHMSRDRQPQSRSARLPRPRLIHPVEPLEDAMQMLRRDALPEVPHTELHCGSIRRVHGPRADHDAASLRIPQLSVLDPFFDQVP